MRSPVALALPALITLALALPARGERLGFADRVPDTDPQRGLPFLLRGSGDTTWVQIHLPGSSPCDPDLISAGGDIHDADQATQTVDDVWCFEGAGGDSTWPAAPGGTSQTDWGHWARNLPPTPEPTRWHVTTLYGDTQTGVFNAWCGCDSLGTSTACADIAFWVNKTGYGNSWEHAMILDLSSLGAQTPGTVSFSLRYDAECVYDYLYLEYLDPGTGAWATMTDSLDINGAQVGTAAVFNGVSANPDISDVCDNGVGGPLDGNYFNTGASNPNGQGTYYGNAAWYHDVSFPLPVNPDLKIRWRASSDAAWSDEDGRGDTEGLAAIDNVFVTFANGDTLTDDFEFGDFDHVRVNGTPTTGLWTFRVSGNTYDGWHLTFDPRYKNKGNTCTFSSDWMWAAKPDTSPIPENGFDFLLVSPVIPVDGWSGGVIRYSSYLCAPIDRGDGFLHVIRRYDAQAGEWTPWGYLYDVIIVGGCEFWNTDDADNLTPFLGTSIDSLQVGFEFYDSSDPGDWTWGKHGGVQMLIDNFAIGRFDTEATSYAVAPFVDTFSRADPAHTAWLRNENLGRWIGIPGGIREFATYESLGVEVTDPNGMTSGNVDLCWRADSGHGTPYETWKTKPMEFAQQNPSRPPGEGTYRAIVGDDQGGTEDYSGFAGDGLIWDAGQTIQYYIRAVDDLLNVSTFPAEAADPVDPEFSEFSVLPLNIGIDGNVITSFDENGAPLGTCILLVDEGGYVLDFENSSGFDPTGGAGFGTFTDYSTARARTLMARSLALLYGGSADDPRWDTYDVGAPGSGLQLEPPGTSDVGAGLGAYMTDAQTPYYDALIWNNERFIAWTYGATTRLELGVFLDAGGKLFSLGDNVAFDLGSGGNNADSLIGFLQTYLGTSLPSGQDYVTENRILNVSGEPGSPLNGVTLGLYGECPFRRTFDRLTLAPPAVGSANLVLAHYANGGPGDNGRPAIIKNIRTTYGGVAVHAGFGIGALLSDASRACLLGDILADDFGLPVTNAVACVNNGVTTPVVTGSGVYELSSAAPSPFTDATGIRFTVPVRTHVTLEVFNVLGQRVRTLVDETLEADAYAREWDGRDDEGAAVSGGIYFYRMIAGDYRATRKAVRLR